MIQQYIKRFMEKKDEVRAVFEAAHPDDYKSIVETVVRTVTSGKYDDLDPDRIHVIDDGDYQGTLVFVIAGKGYQPYRHFYVEVSYGSCSVCDTLEGIRGYSDGRPDKEQVDDYMTLALHIVQGLKEMGDEMGCEEVEA